MIWLLASHRRIDSSTWRIMGSHATGFTRIKAPVLFFRAEKEDNALFNFAFDDEDGRMSYGACSRMYYLCLSHAQALYSRFSFIQCTDINGRIAVTTSPSWKGVPITSHC